MSIDYLFDRKDSLNRSIDEIISEAQKCDPDRSVELLTAASERYPNNPRLMYELAWCKCKAAKELGADSEAMKDAAELFEKLTRITDDDIIRAHALDRLSKISFLRQDYDKALYYNSKILPPDGLYPRSEYAIIKLCQCDNSEALHTAKETIYRIIYEYSNILTWVLDYYHNHDMLTEAIDEASRGIEILELFSHSRYLFKDLSIYYEYLAYIHALRNEFDKVLDNLELAYKYAVKCDTVEISEKYKLFGDIVDEHNIPHTERMDLLAALSSQSRKIYEPIKKTPRFNAIITGLKDSIDVEYD